MGKNKSKDIKQYDKDELVRKYRECGVSALKYLYDKCEYVKYGVFAVPYPDFFCRYKPENTVNIENICFSSIDIFKPKMDMTPEEESMIKSKYKLERVFVLGVDLDNGVVYVIPASIKGRVLVIFNKFIRRILVPLNFIKLIFTVKSFDKSNKFKGRPSIWSLRHFAYDVNYSVIKRKQK